DGDERNRGCRMAPPFLCEAQIVLERVFELQLQCVIRLRILRGELVRRDVVEYALRAAHQLRRLTRRRDERAAREDLRAVRAAEIPSAPVLVEQVQEIEDVQLQDEVLSMQRGQRLACRRVHNLVPGRTTR